MVLSHGSAAPSGREIFFGRFPRVALRATLGCIPLPRWGKERVPRLSSSSPSKLRSPLSLAPGFSRVSERDGTKETVSTVSVWHGKTDESVLRTSARNTGLKPGANERLKQFLPAFFFVLFAPFRG